MPLDSGWFNTDIVASNPGGQTYGLGLVKSQVFNVRPIHLLMFALVPALVLLWRKRLHNTTPMRDLAYHRGLFLCLAGALAWGTVSLLWLPHTLQSAVNWGRFASNLILICYVVLVLKNINQIERTLQLLFLVSLVVGVSALIADSKAFYLDRFFVAPGGGGALIRISLFNKAAGVATDAIGMLVGWGLTSKHSFGMCMFAGLCVVPFLLLRARTHLSRTLLVAGGLFLSCMLFHGPNKLTIVGGMSIPLLMCVPSRRYRIILPSLALLIVLLVAVGLVVGVMLRPGFTTRRDKGVGNADKITDASRYEFGSINYRLSIWQHTMRRSVGSRFIGCGAGSLREDFMTTSLFPHNLPLQLLHDYGLPGLLFIGGLILAICRGAFLLLYEKTPCGEEKRLLLFCLLLAALVLFFETLFDVQAWESQIWVHLALLWAAIRVPENGKEGSQLAWT